MFIARIVHTRNCTRDLCTPSDKLRSTNFKKQIKYVKYNFDLATTEYTALGANLSLAHNRREHTSAEKLFFF